VEAAAVVAEVLVVLAIVCVCVCLYPTYRCLFKPFYELNV